MKRIVILILASDFSTDPRVYKQALSAREDGWDVTVCCYHNFKKYTDTVEEGCRIIRIPFAQRLGLIPGIPTAILEKLTRKIITGHKTTSLDNQTHIQPPITQTINTYLWASVLYGFAQVHFFCYALKHKSDVYHATDLITLLTGTLLKIARGGKLVYDSHEMWIDSMENYTKNLQKIVGIYERILIHRADAVTTVNEPIAEELAARYTIKKPTVIMNTPHLQPQPTHKPHDDIRVIYQGRYAKNRGIELAINGVTKVNQVSLYMRGIDAYGDGVKEPYVDELKQISPKTIFIPPVGMRELVQSLDEYDIGIVPYIGNNFNNLNASPNKIFEYMMAGLAIITSDIPVMKHVVEKCGCGFTYKQEDPEDLAHKLAMMLPHIDDMKQNAREWAEREYNWNVQGRKLVDIYNLLIK